MNNFENLFDSNSNKEYIETNKWIVASLQDALRKYAPPNSRGVYHSQDGEYEYEIFTDRNGIKSYDTYKRILCTKEQTQKPVTHEDLKIILDQIKSLEEKYAGSKTDSTSGITEMSRPENGQPNTK